MSAATYYRPVGAWHDTTIRITDELYARIESLREQVEIRDGKPPSFNRSVHRLIEEALEHLDAHPTETLKLAAPPRGTPRKPCLFRVRHPLRHRLRNERAAYVEAGAKMSMNTVIVSLLTLALDLRDAP